MSIRKQTIICTIAVLLILFGAVLAADRADAASEAYTTGIEGGAIYIDWTTNTVTDCDSTVTSAVIPEGITTISTGAFLGCSDLVSVEMPESITEIGKSAFTNCGNLSEIDLPIGLKTIRNSAFMNCTALSSIGLQENLETLEPNAFRNCSSLTEVTIPDNIIEVPAYAFSLCSNLETVFLSDNTKKLGDGAFSQCGKLKNINYSGIQEFGSGVFSECISFESFVIPEGVTEINGLLSYCTGLTQVTIPESVTKIGNSTFAGCTKLTEIDIPDGVTSIGNYAFSSCTGLTEIVIPNGVTSIGDYSFQECIFETFDIPDSVNSIGKWAFQNCRNLKSIEIPEGITNIGEYTFYGCLTLENLSLPSTLESIGNYAFWGCELSSISVPEKVTTIGEWAFRDCALISAYIPEGVTFIGAKAFDGNASEFVATVHEGSYAEQYMIDNSINYKLFKLQELTSASVEIEAIADQTYTGSAITPKPVVKFTDEEGAVTELVEGDDFTYSYVNNTDVGTATLRIEGINMYTGTVSTSFKIVGQDMSQGQIVLQYNQYVKTGSEIKPITTVMLNGNTLVEGTDYTLSYQNNIEAGTDAKVIATGKGNYSGALTAVFTIVRGEEIYFYLDSGQTQWLIYNSKGEIIGYGCEDDNYIIDLSIPAQINEIKIVSIAEKCFENDSKLNSVTTSGTLDRIDPRAFYNCSGLTSIDLSAKNIEEYAFCSCENLQSITLKNTEKIRNNAFKYCYSLTELNLPDTLTYFGYNSFYDCTSLTKLVIPDSVRSVGAYSFACCGYNANENLEFTVPADAEYFRYALRAGNTVGVFTVTKGQTGVLDATLAEYFKSRNTIKKVVLSEGIVEIGASAFYRFDYSYGRCEELVIPSTLKIIGEKAFAETRLKSLIIPAGVTSIGKGAFQNMKYLETVNFANGSVLTDLPENAFRGCSVLKTVALPSSLKTIGDYAFRDCKVMQEIQIPSGVTVIGTKAFYNCQAIESLTIPSGVKDIAASAFSRCSGLTSITLPASLETVQKNAFNRCTGLTAVEMPKTVRSLGYNAFGNCSNLASIALPNTLEQIDVASFGYCNSLTFLELPISAQWRNEKGNSYGNLTPALKTYSLLAGTGTGYDYTEYYNDDTYRNLPWYLSRNNSGLTIKLAEGIKYIGNYTFAETTITEITLPASLEGLGKYVFNNASKLQTVTLADGCKLKTVEDGAFYRNTSLKTLVLPKQVESIGMQAFSGCSALAEIILPEIIVQADITAFENCSNVTSMEFPISMKWVNGKGTSYGSNYMPKLAKINITPGTGYGQDYYSGTSAYEGQCGILPWNIMRYGNGIDITLEEGIKYIGDYTFADSGAKSITLPASLESLGRYVFQRNQKLQTVTFAEGCKVKELPYEAFADNYQLKEIRLPDALESLGDRAFANCYALTSIGIPDGVTEIGYQTFSQCQSLMEASLPDSLETIDSEAFINCQQLDGVVFPEGLKNIYLRAFSNCGLSGELLLPDSLRNVDCRAFENCRELTSMTVPLSAWWMNNSGLEANNTMWNIQTYNLTPGTGSAYNYTAEGSNSYTHMPWNCQNQYNITINLAEGITYVGDYTFAGSTLKTINLPESLLQVGDYAFYRCKSLQTVDMKDKVWKIDYGAFAECENLKSITLPDSLTVIRYNSFAGDDNLVATVTENTYALEAAVKYEIPYKLSADGPVITPEPDESTPGAIRAGAGYGSAGSTVRVPVEITVNPGVTMLTLEMIYDKNVLELTSVENGAVFEEESLTVDTANLAAASKLFWSNSTTEEDIETTGTLVTLTFKVKDTAAAGTYDVELLCSETDGAYNAAGELVKFDTVVGSANVKPYRYGDISGDSAVDMADVTVTKYYIAGFDAYKNLAADAADVDVSGSVTARDLMILERYLAHWKGYDYLPDTRTSLA